MDRDQLRMDDVETGGEVVSFGVDNQPWTGREGDTIASALYAGGRRSWRRGKSGDPRGLLCGMGICYDCHVTVDTVPGIRACQEYIRPGMIVETGLLDEQAVVNPAGREGGLDAQNL